MKRFWKDAAVEEAEDGWAVLLDARPVRTPARRAVVVPVRSMAEEIATEWQAQEDTVDPRTMPMTRVAATCLDRVAPERAEVARMIAAYGETDLLCYRADRPVELRQRQEIAWDPVLAWAEERFAAPLVTGTGVMHMAQPEASTLALARAADEGDSWILTGLSELTTISGSLVLGLAVRHGWLDVSEAWALSRIDEQWNIEEWGEDEEAAALAARREADFRLAARTIALITQG